MHEHAKLMWLCGLMIVAAIVAGVITGNAAVLLPVAGCVVMMGAMMLMMARMGRHHH